MPSTLEDRLCGLGVTDTGKLCCEKLFYGAGSVGSQLRSHPLADWPSDFAKEGDRSFKKEIQQDQKQNLRTETARKLNICIWVNL